MIYPRFTKDLTKNKHIFIVLPSKNLPKIYQRLTINLPKIYSAYQTLTQSIPKIYPWFTQNLVFTFYNLPIVVAGTLY